MIIAQLNWKFDFSNRQGILRGKHNRYKMRVVEIPCLSIAILPRNSSQFYWDSLDKLAMDKNYLIKNNARIEKAEKKAKDKMERMYASENKKLRERIEELEARHIEESNNIRAMKKTIKIVKAT